MASERQVRANRLNALKSTGPRSEDGKAFSSRNALRHGLTSLQIVLEGEDAAAYETLRCDLVEEFAPRTVLQTVLVDQLAVAIWRLRRAAVFEIALFSWIGDQQSKSYDQDGIELGDVFLPLQVSGLARASRAAAFSARDLVRTGRTLEAAMGKSDMLTKLSRYESHLIRQIERTLSLIGRASRS